MAAHQDHNGHDPGGASAAEALRFALVAAGTLILLRLGHAVIDGWLRAEDALGLATAPFRRGYLLPHPHAVVPDAMELPGRLALGVLIGIAAGVIGALLGWCIATIAGDHGRKGLLAGARLGASLFTLAAMVLAVAMPREELRFSADGVLVVERKTLPGGCTWPFDARRSFYAWSQVGSIATEAGTVRLSFIGPPRSIVVQTGTGSHTAEALTDALRALHAARPAH